MNTRDQEMLKDRAENCVKEISSASIGCQAARELTIGENLDRRILGLTREIAHLTAIKDRLPHSVLTLPASTLRDLC